MCPDYSTSKVCTKCGEELPATAEYFCRHQQAADGFNSWCKTCHRAYNRRWHSEHKEQERAAWKVYYKKNQDRRRESRLQREFGIGHAEYVRILENQGGVCAICGEPPNGSRRPHIDHDHTTGAVRGVLCQACNKGLGFFADNTDRLQRAIDYLGEAE